LKPVTGLLFIEVLYALAFNVLVVFYRGLGNNLGIAIIVFTLFLKFLTLPFALRQVSTAKKSKEFQEKYKALQQKHKDDKEKLTKELASLQSEYLPAQLGGCLPMILQLLFFFQVYYVIINTINVGPEAFNAIRYPFIPAFASGETINLSFLGMNLGHSAASIGFANIGAVLPYLILVLLVGVTQFISGRVTSGMSIIPGRNKIQADAKANSNAAVAKKDSNSKSSKKNKDAKGKVGKDGKVAEDFSFGDAMQESSKQMLYILPVMTMMLSLSFPAGLSLYWTVTSGFAIIQQLIMNRDKVKAWWKSTNLANKLNINKQP
jgi:YidC/Oxa1 family membrane protein insertase